MHACRPMLKQLMRAPDAAASLTTVEAAELLHFCFLDVLRHLGGAADAPAAAAQAAAPLANGGT